MSKTIEQKVTQKIMIILGRCRDGCESYKKHIVVHDSVLKLRHSNDLCTGDIYVLKVTNQHGNAQSKRIVSICVSILNRQIALTPLLTKRRRKESPLTLNKS